MTVPGTYVTPGCVVEFLEDNEPQVALTLETGGGKVRLLLPNRRETKLSQARLLPWIGPVYSPNMGKDEAARLLESHKKARETGAAQIDTMELWELAQGELTEADVGFFADLVETDADADTLAAYGRALLANKTRFRFNPPNFTIFEKEIVEKREEEKKRREERETFVAGGANFLRLLWDIACKKRGTPITPNEEPAPELAEKLEKMLFARMINPDTDEDDALWRLIGKGLPEVQHLPLQLLTAWGKLPPHYNFWLDRADYDRGDEWWRDEAESVDELAAKATPTGALSVCDLPFLSVDNEFTRDIDDAFYIEKNGDGWNLTLAFAAPALYWPFGSSLDKKVAHRGTSLYLPEGDLHMLPQKLSLDAYSLLEGERRPAFCVTLNADAEGNILACRPFPAAVVIKANLRYDDVQATLEGRAGADNPSFPHAEILGLAHAFALAREKKRIADGAVVMRRPEQIISLDTSAGEPVVKLEEAPEDADAHRLVGEMMIAASAAMADWARDNGFSLIHRTQNVAIPKEYAGVWDKPEDLAAIMRAMAPSILEVEAKPHAALAAPRYAPITSPLRRYVDLINEAQTLSFLRVGSPEWSQEELNHILDALSPNLEASAHAQRFRPRYWKLLYFRQQGDKVWWNGVVTEENDNFVTVSLPGEGLFVRGKRDLFDERAFPGAPVKIRLGKINPLYNDISILEALPGE